MTHNILYPLPGVVYHDDDTARHYLNAGAWSGHSVGDTLRATALRFPDRLAITGDMGNLSFAELDEQSERLAAALWGLGLNPGDRAMFQMGTSIATVVCLAACFKAGIVPVCSLPQHRDVEISQLMAKTQARAYFVQSDVGNFDLVAFAARMMQSQSSAHALIVAQGASDAAIAQKDVPTGNGSHVMQALIGTMPLAQARQVLASRPGPGPRDVLTFQLSGGSTGLPKIIPRFHGEYLGQSRAWMGLYRIDSNSRIIWSLSILHNAGQLYALIPAFSEGVTIVLMPRVDIRRMLELIAEHRVTHALSIGPVAPQIMAYEDLHLHDLSSLQLFATMSRADHLQDHLGVPCSNLYGITEGLLLGTSALSPVYARHHTQGRSGCALDDLRLLLPDTEDPAPPGEMGELCFRGPSTLLGFYDAADINAQAYTRQGYYRSGDMMSAHVIDGETYFRFEGRLRDNVNRGGEKIGCEEVEEYVSMHPSVADAKLVAMPDPFYMEKGCVYLILRPGMSSPSVDELSAFLLKKGLAKYKCPERIEILDAFPTTRVGKVDKATLRAMVAQAMAHENQQEQA